MSVMKFNAISVRVAVWVSSVVVVSTAWAVDIYKWEDEKGQVFVSDVVPNKYKKTATRIEVRSNESAVPTPTPTPTPAAKKAVTGPAASPAPAAANTPQSAPKPAIKPATDLREQEATDCETLQRLYRESQDCFAPFRNATGGIKAEAYEKCKERPEPTEKCPIPQGQ